MLAVSRARGYTLLELMVTVGIVAIVAALAAPSFTTTIERQKVRSTANDLVNSLNLARSEAIKRNKPVGVRPITGNDWGTGSEIVVDPDGDNTVLARKDPYDGFQITSDPAGVTRVLFDSNGRVSEGDASFDARPTSGSATNAYCVGISLNGRPKSEKGEC